MPLNDRKIIKIIQEECQTVKERYKGYHQDLIELVADIITEERQHHVQGTNIQQRINDKCNAAGRILAERHGEGDKLEKDDR